MWYWPRSPNCPTGWDWYGSKIRHFGLRRGRGLSGGSPTVTDSTAIRSYCERNNTIRHAAGSVEEKPGRGLKATFKAEGFSAIIGKLMSDHTGSSAHFPQKLCLGFPLSRRFWWFL